MEEMKKGIKRVKIIGKGGRQEREEERQKE
jgi:hypothetical protein